MKKLRLTMLTLLIVGTTSAFSQSMSKKYKTVVASQVIEAPASRVWEAMVLDYGEIANFSPFIYASDYTAGSLKGELGAERKCWFNEKGSRWSHEKIMTIDPKEMVMKNVVVDAAKFPLDLDNSYALYKVRDNGDGTSTASYEFLYRTSPGFMTGLVKGRFKKTLEGTLVGLKHYVETGEKVNPQEGNWKEVKRIYAKNNR